MAVAGASAWAPHRTCHPAAVLVAVPEPGATEQEQVLQVPGYLFVIVMLIK